MGTAQTSVFLSTLGRKYLSVDTVAVLMDISSMPLISALVSETLRSQRMRLVALRIGSSVTTDDALHRLTSAMAIMIALT